MTAELTADVIICTYTDERWDLLDRSIRSVMDQSVMPQKVIVVVDHNRELTERCRAHWWAGDSALRVPVEIVENRFDGRLGSARNTGLLLATADVVAFLDDDAEAATDWLERLLNVYASNPSAVAVGGAPRPKYSVPRPNWFPTSFDWVFGCHYRSMPSELAPVRHLIGASMSVRRDFILGAGGFHADDHDDMDLSHRVFHARGPAALLYEPRAEVYHHVPPERLTWNYFWRRCFYVNRSKVAAVAQLGDAGNLGAEFRFAARTLLEVGPASLAAIAGESTRLRQWLVEAVGTALAGAGYLSGKMRLMRGIRPGVMTTGLTPEDVARSGAIAGVEDA
jgi:glucosyl-dolichyl phosphate glucuronosyltransferase